MALTTDISQSAPLHNVLKHYSTNFADGVSTTLITGITGKRIRIWRLHTYCGGANKTCEFLSGTDGFPKLNTTKSYVHELKSSDGVPVYTCNDGEDFIADPNDATAWYFYLVYSIE